MYEIKHPIKLKCQVCGKNFIHNNANTLTCSEKCRKEKNNFRSGRIGDKTITAGTVGAISEMLVCADLMSKGYAVFRALSPACFCDAIATKGDKILKVEIRTAYMNQFTGKLSYPIKLHGDEKNKADCYGLYERSKKEVLFRDINGKEIVI